MHVYFSRDISILNFAVWKAKITKVRHIKEDIPKKSIHKTQKFCKKWNVPQQLWFFLNITKCLILIEYSCKITYVKGATSCFVICHYLIILVIPKFSCRRVGVEVIQCISTQSVSNIVPESVQGVIVSITSKVIFSNSKIKSHMCMFNEGGPKTEYSGSTHDTIASKKNYLKN